MFKSALLRNATATSFKHALYWLMRNLLKISRGTAGVNVEWILAGVSAQQMVPGVGLERPGDPSCQFQPSLRDWSGSYRNPGPPSWAKFSRPFGTRFAVGWFVRNALAYLLLVMLVPNFLSVLDCRTKRRALVAKQAGSG